MSKRKLKRVEPQHPEIVEFKAVALNADGSVNWTVINDVDAYLITLQQSAGSVRAREMSQWFDEWSRITLQRVRAREMSQWFDEWSRERGLS